MFAANKNKVSKISTVFLEEQKRNLCSKVTKVEKSKIIAKKVNKYKVGALLSSHPYDCSSYPLRLYIVSKLS
jgi:IS5 family transposase